MKKFKSGFTLTELSIAIVFISVLLLTIAAVTINLGNMYHKGNTMKQINTIGLELIDEFSSAVAAAPARNFRDLCTADEINDDKCNNGLRYIFSEKTAAIKYAKSNTTVSTTDRTQEYGIFCTGKYTYIWNTGYVLGQKTGFDSSSNLYTGGNTFHDSTFRLLKYSDQSGGMCKEGLDGLVNAYDPSDNSININGSNHLPIGGDLISTKDIAIYKFWVDTPVQSEDSTQGAMLVMHLVLGSITGGVDINNDYAGCDAKTAAEAGDYDLNHCAAFEFTFSQVTQDSGIES